MEQKLSERVIGCAIEVSRELGSGYLEKIYEAALAIELERIGIRFHRQRPLSVSYKGAEIGKYFCDFVVEERLIVELKAANVMMSEHEAQVLHYLKATGIRAALLLNFGAAKLGIRRLVREHDDNDPI